MKNFMKTKAGVALVGFSVLAVSMLLAAHSVQAHSLTNPSCSGLPNDDFFNLHDDIVAILKADDPEDDSVSTRKGTGDSGEGNIRFHYAKIIVPALTVGDLVVEEATATNPSEAILCGRQEGSVSSLPSYTRPMLMPKAPLPLLTGTPWMPTPSLLPPNLPSHALYVPPPTT